MSAADIETSIVVILMGVAGAGKTTIGRLLANALGWRFYEADAYHSADNIKKMEAGEPLTDNDREPWLRSLRAVIDKATCRSEPTIIACSALKESYRTYLAQSRDNVRFVYLKGDYELLRKRLEGRKDHFFNSKLLRSQFDALEEPRGVLIVDVMRDPQSIVNSIKEALTRSDWR